MDIIIKVLTGIPTESDEYVVGRLPLEDQIQRAYATPEGNGEVFSAQELEALAKCLRRMLVVDQTKRPTTRELLTEEEWFRIR